MNRPCAARWTRGRPAICTRFRGHRTPLWTRSTVVTPAAHAAVLPDFCSRRGKSTELPGCVIRRAWLVHGFDSCGHCTHCSAYCYRLGCGAQRADAGHQRLRTLRTAALILQVVRSLLTGSHDAPNHGRRQQSDGKWYACHRGGTCVHVRGAVLTGAGSRVTAVTPQLQRGRGRLRTIV